MRYICVSVPSFVLFVLLFPPKDILSRQTARTFRSAHTNWQSSKTFEPSKQLHQNSVRAHSLIADIPHGRQRAPLLMASLSRREEQISSHEPNRFEFQTHHVLESYCAAQSIDLKETPSLKQADPVQPLWRQQKSSFLQIGVLRLCQWTCFEMYSLLVRTLQRRNFFNSHFAVRVE